MIINGILHHIKPYNHHIFRVGQPPTIISNHILTIINHHIKPSLTMTIGRSTTNQISYFLPHDGHLQKANPSLLVDLWQIYDNISSFVSMDFPAHHWAGYTGPWIEKLSYDGVRRVECTVERDGCDDLG